MSDEAIGEIQYADFEQAINRAIEATTAEFKFLTEEREDKIATVMKTVTTGWLWWKRLMTKSEATYYLFPSYCYTEWHRVRNRLERLEKLRETFSKPTIGVIHFPEHDIRLFNEYL
jgi:hypothetical protein